MQPLVTTKERYLNLERLKSLPYVRVMGKQMMDISLAAAYQPDSTMLHDMGIFPWFSTQAEKIQKYKNQ